MIATILNYFRDYLDKDAREARLRRMAEIEYKKDADYAFYMLSIGKIPYSD